VASQTSLLAGRELEDAKHAWMRGEWPQARTAAQRVLGEAAIGRDRRLEAGASLLLAQVLSLESRFTWARKFAARAKLLYSAIAAPEGVAEAMLATSGIESALGNDELAVAAAQAAIDGLNGAARRPAAGLHCLGLAALWTCEYGKARDLFAQARGLATQDGSAAFQSLAHSLLAEVLRCMELRAGGHRPDFADLDALVDEGWRLVKTAAAGPLDGGPAGLLLLEFASCFLTSRSGRLTDANEHYVGCLQQAAQLPASSWLHVLVWWARLERTLAGGETGEAALSVASMVAAADAGEHLPLKELAQILGVRANRHLDRAAAMPPCYLPVRGTFAADPASTSFEPLPACAASSRRECRACVRNMGHLQRPELHSRHG
jgi:hypothetical protein